MLMQTWKAQPREERKARTPVTGFTCKPPSHTHSSASLALTYPPSMCSNYQDPVKFCSGPGGTTSFVSYCFLFPKLMFKLGVSDRDYQVPSGFHSALFPLGKGTSHPSRLAVDTMKAPCGRVEPCDTCVREVMRFCAYLKETLTVTFPSPS